METLVFRNVGYTHTGVPPSGGSLEIGNVIAMSLRTIVPFVPPSGGSLEIGNTVNLSRVPTSLRNHTVPPSGGSLEIGNPEIPSEYDGWLNRSPFRGIPRNWKHAVYKYHSCLSWLCSPFGGIPRNWKRGQSSTRPRSHVRCSPFGGIPRNWKHIFAPLSTNDLLLFPLRGDP